MGKGSEPSAPDPVVTAQAQAAANKETAIASQELNMINQYTPYGSLEFDQRGTSETGTPQYSATQTLSPEERQKLDLSQQAGIQYGQTAVNQLGQVSDKLSAPLDYSGFGPAPTANEATRGTVADSLYNRMEPLMDRDRARLEDSLFNRGFTENSPGWKDAMDQEGRNRTDARLAVENQALSQMSQLYGLERSARDSDINELIQQRQIPLNELAAMLSGGQVQGPSFVSGPQGSINPADFMGATYASYQGDLDRYRTQQGSQNAMAGGLFGLGAAGLEAYGNYNQGAGG